MAELVTNPGIETNMTGWNTSNISGTMARSTVQAHSGVASMALTATGANTYIWANETLLDVVEASIYSASWWVYVADTANYTPVAGDGNGDWERYGSTVSITANTWTQVSVTGFAAGVWTGTDEFIFRLNRSTGTYSGQILHFDDFSLTSQERRSSLLLGV